MSMTDPNILQLLDKADCRYTLVVEVSKAIDEVNRGLITYERTAEADVR